MVQLTVRQRLDEERVVEERRVAASHAEHVLNDL